MEKQTKNQDDSTMQPDANFETQAVSTEEPFKNMLFKPMISKSNPARTIDFDNLIVPFMVKNNKIFAIMFMDGCCSDLSIYSRCLNVDPEKPSESYCDATDLMRECLEVQELIGTEYYFGSLNHGLQYYMYAMWLFTDRGLISKESALENISRLGCDMSDLPKYFNTKRTNGQLRTALSHLLNFMAPNDNNITLPDNEQDE